MKVLRDKVSGEMFVKMNSNDKHVVSLFDQKIYEVNEAQLEEVDVKPKNSASYEVATIKRERFSVGSLAERDWALKEVVTIPVGKKLIPFRVEHITNEKVYLVAVDTVGRSTMKDMDEYLDSFLSNIPKAFLDICGEIEHKVNGYTIRKSKVTLLSYGNTTGCENCNGADDMQFSGLKTEAERCKNNADGETCWYWEDTPYDYEDWDEDSALASGFTLFLYVNTTGNPYSYGNASSTYGVCPCLSILRTHSSEAEVE